MAKKGINKPSFLFDKQKFSMKKFLLVVFHLIVIAAVVGFYYFVKNPTLPLAQQYLPMIGINVSAPVTQMANPASVYCEQHSGTTEITTDLSGNQA